MQVSPKTPNGQRLGLAEKGGVSTRWDDKDTRRLVGSVSHLVVLKS